MIELDRDEPGFVTTLVAAATEPPARVAELGIQVVAVTSPGTMVEVPVRLRAWPLWYCTVGVTPIA